MWGGGAPGGDGDGEGEGGGEDGDEMRIGPQSAQSVPVSHSKLQIPLDTNVDGSYM